MKDLGNISIPNKNPRKDKQKTSTVLVNHPKTKHTSNRTTKHFLSNKYIFLIVCICALVAWVYYIPPNNAIAVVPFIFLLTSIFSILTSHFSRKIHVFSTLFMFVFLLMSYFIGFDIINTLVLLSFIIVLSTLFKANA